MTYLVKYDCAITGRTLVETCYTKTYANAYAELLRNEPRVTNVRVEVVEGR